MPSSLMKPGNKCSLCVRIFKWFPVVFITAIVVWSYYAYIIQLCFFTVDYLIEKILYFVVYHIVFIVFVWAYWQTIFTNVAVVPKEFRLSPSDAELFERESSEDNQRRLLERYAKDLPVVCRTLNGAIRYCEKCHHIKPDRAHHCSVCGTCVLKMDHHCPWVNNCVSFTNYKYFILFLGYALLYCLFIAATSLRYFIRFWTSELEGIGRFHILFLFFVSVMFAISLVSLFGYHCYLVSVNRSTLESFRAPIFVTGPDKDGFNLGKYKNFVQIFGEDRKNWFLPVYTSFGDGVSYPTRIQPASSYNSMENTAQPSVGNGTSFPQRKIEEDSTGLLNQRQHWIDMPDDDQIDQHESIAGYGRESGDPAVSPKVQPSYPV